MGHMCKTGIAPKAPPSPQFCLKQRQWCSPTVEQICWGGHFWTSLLSPAKEHFPGHSHLPVLQQCCLRDMVNWCQAAAAREGCRQAGKHHWQKGAQHRLQHLAQLWLW